MKTLPISVFEDHFAIIGGEPYQHRIVHHQFEPKGEDQRHQHRLSNDTIDDEELGHVAERAERNRRCDDRDEGMNAQQIVGEQRDIGAQHDERAVQQIDDAEHAPDEREAGRDACIEAAENEAVREILKKDHGLRLV